jgi:hypothetical protein
MAENQAVWYEKKDKNNLNPKIALENPLQSQMTENQYICRLILCIRSAATHFGCC